MAYLMHIVLAVLATGVGAQSSTDCTSAYSLLAPCYSYVTGPGTSPPSSCYAELGPAGVPVLRHRAAAAGKLQLGPPSAPPSPPLQQSLWIAASDWVDIECQVLTLCNGTASRSVNTSNPYVQIPLKSREE
jgi:hypothetical protein